MREHCSYRRHQFDDNQLSRTLDFWQRPPVHPSPSCPQSWPVKGGVGWNAIQPRALHPCCPSLPSHSDISYLHRFPRHVFLSKSLHFCERHSPHLSERDNDIPCPPRELVAKTFQKMHTGLAHIICSNMTLAQPYPVNCVNSGKLCDHSEPQFYLP